MTRPYVVVVERSDDDGTRFVDAVWGPLTGDDATQLQGELREQQRDELDAPSFVIVKLRRREQRESSESSTREEALGAIAPVEGYAPEDF